MVIPLFCRQKEGLCVQRKETYDLPPPALSGSGSKGTSQPFGAPGVLLAIGFRTERQTE
jgi:hypothetical protein